MSHTPSKDDLKQQKASFFAVKASQYPKLTTKKMNKYFADTKPKATSTESELI